MLETGILFDMSNEQTLKPYVIKPQNSWVPIDIVELWQYRDLLWILAARDIRVRYKQTVIGGAWALLQPLVTTGIFTLLFAALLGRDHLPVSGKAPYAFSTFCAMLPWQLFAFALMHASLSMVENQRLVSKVYFPRILIPVASVASGLMDFVVGFAMLILLMIFGYGIYPQWQALTMPFFVFMALLSACGVGIGMSALNAMYRDIGYTVPFLVQAGLFVTPVVYDAQSILPKLPYWVQVLYMLNPMAGVVEGFRWALLDGPLPSMQLLAISFTGVVLIFAAGCLYFARVDRTLADWI